MRYQAIYSPISTKNRPPACHYTEKHLGVERFQRLRFGYGGNLFEIGAALTALTSELYFAPVRIWGMQLTVAPNTLNWTWGLSPAVLSGCGISCLVRINRGNVSNGNCASAVRKC